MFSCGKKKEEDLGVLMRFGEETITFEDVNEKIPRGISPADSASLFDAILDSWVKDMVLARFAEDRLIDTEAIDQRVREYRNQLIVQEYLSKMRETQSPNVPAEKVKEYYDTHRKELKLETPLIKGVFIKINSDFTGQEEIKKLLTSDTPESIDKLENDWMDKAVEYNYFRDKWVDLYAVEGMMPYNFGKPETEGQENKLYEAQYNDFTYYLLITDYLEVGEEQPFEYAKGWITNLLTQGYLSDYEHSLVNSLVEKAIKEKKLETPGYDPIHHELTLKETR